MAVSDVRASWATRTTIGVGVAAMGGAVFGAGTLTAAAATAPKVGIDFSNTRIQSVRIYARQDPRGNWISACVAKDPHAVVTDSGLEGGVLVIKSYTQSGCSAGLVHKDQVHWPGTPIPWVVAVQSLDDDDPSNWTQ